MARPRPHRPRGLAAGPLLLAGLLMGGWPGVGAAVEWRQPFQVLGPDDGLPASAPITLAQDPDGFLWVGTEDGAARYEGGRHRRWTVADGLPSAYVQRLLRAPDGALWATTQRGLVRWRDGRFEPARLEADPHVSTVALGFDPAGRLWVVTQGAVYAQRHELVFERRATLREGEVAAIGATSGRLYLASAGHLVATAPDGAVRRWGPADGVPGVQPSLIVEDGAGRLWIGAGRTLAVLAAGASRFDDRSALLHASLSPNGNPFVDHDGSAWLPTREGALHLVDDRAEWLDAAAGLPFRWVRSVFRDREGTLWILGPALARLQGEGRVANAVLTKDGSGELVWAVIRDARGQLLVGTDDGLLRLGSSGPVTVPGTAGRRLKALLFDRGGTLWMTSTIGPALWLRPGAARAEVAPLGELGDSINTLLEDRRGTIWIAHARHGVLRWDPGAGRLVQDQATLADRPRYQACSDLREDAAGRIWAATDAGLELRDPDGTWHLFTERDGLRPHGARAVGLRPDGTAWVAWNEPQGLTRVRVEGARLTVLEQRTRGPGLRSDLIYGLRQDPGGRMWVSTDQGVDLLDSPLHVGRRDGMVSEDCSIHALLAEADQLLVGTSAGLVRIDTRGAGAALEPPATHLVQVTLGDRRLEPPFHGVAPLDWSARTVEATLATPASARERDVHYQVRLVGLEDAWRDAPERVVRYPALPAGRYALEARAAVGDGPFGRVAAIDFEVRSPWWRTWWAVSLLAAALAGSALGAIRLRLLALARAKAALEVLVTARTAELSLRNGELSDALGKVKELSGLLPICMHCHKIRNDSGYWERIEKYVSERTRANFSHGLCPDCVKRYDPVE
jgi:ligand-binding sensor domain-containing protein